MNIRSIVFMVIFGVGFLLGTVTSCKVTVGPKTVVTIPEEKRAEAAVLYQAIYQKAVDNGRSSWATEDAEDAINKIYGKVEVVRNDKSGR